MGSSVGRDRGRDLTHRRSDVGLLSRDGCFFIRANVDSQRSGSRQAAGNSIALALVVGQFTVAIVLMICVIGMSHQLSFLTTKELGFVKRMCW